MFSVGKKHPQKQAWRGKWPFFKIGDTSTHSWLEFSIVMLVLGGLYFFRLPTQKLRSFKGCLRENNPVLAQKIGETQAHAYQGVLLTAF